MMQSSTVSISFFVLFVLIVIFVPISAFITVRAAKRTKDTKAFYTADSSISASQNGIALAGDYMSAASFLGIAGMVATKGFDGLIYSIGFLVGWPVIVFLIAEPIRHLGRYTFVDVVAYRLRQGPTRIAAAIATLSVVIFYLIAQMVGAGGLVKLLFGTTYEMGVVIVAVLMMSYVIFGGMVATTWVQIIKAVLLLAGASLLGLLVLAKFGFSPLSLFATAVQMNGPAVLAPGSLVSNPLDAISLGIALIFGTCGLPHILMRFYSVKDPKAARLSAFYATGWIGYFYLVTFVLGFGAMVLVGRDQVLAAAKGGNMAAPLLANAIGGSAFFGFISAVAFATILAVVAGLTLSGAATLSHDLWVNVVRGGTATDKEQLLVARLTSFVLGALAMVLGIAFKGQNVAFMVGLAFAIAASGIFPALTLSIYWQGLSTAGAVASMLTGTVGSLVLIYLSPTIQIELFERTTAWFPLKSPALITVPLAFVVGVLVSKLMPERAAAEKYQQVKERLRSKTMELPDLEEAISIFPH
jgi:cation/acetate symporter